MVLLPRKQQQNKKEMDDLKKKLYPYCTWIGFMRAKCCDLIDSFVLIDPFFYDPISYD